MEPIKTTIRTVLDVVEEVERYNFIKSYDRCVAERIKHQLYIETLTMIASRTQCEYARDMATEALHAEGEYNG